MPRIIRSPLTIGILFALATVYFQIPVALPDRRAKKYLNPPPESVEHFSFGFAESMADSLWLRWIQDGDVCQTYADVGPIAADPIGDQTALGTSFFNPRHKKCDASWSYKMLDAVTRLAPKFRMPYLAGTMTLAVLVEDYQGSTLLFDRAVENYPDDWQILFRAGYHYMLDMHDTTRGAEMMSRAADHGAPYWVKLLAARIYTQGGQVELGIVTLENYLKTVDREDRRIEVRRRIEELKKQAAAAKAARPPGP